MAVFLGYKGCLTYTPNPNRTETVTATELHRFVFGVRFRFGFGVYVKALIGFKAFYFFGSVSVLFRCLCEMALTSACRVGLWFCGFMSRSTEL